MNESIFNPKWLKDKKAEKERKKKEKERLKQEEEEREYNRLKEEDEKREREKYEEENKAEFNFFFNAIISNIYNEYKKCKVSIPKTNFLVVERDDLLYKNLDFKYKVTLDNTVKIPRFNVEISVNKFKEYNYTASGLAYNELKNFFLDTIYEWYKIEMLYDKDKQKQQKQQQKKYSDDYGGYDYYDYYDDYGETKTKQKQKEPEESEEVKNKRRRYQLLKDTLEGYNRQLAKIKDWERKNPGKTHDEKQLVLNQIENVKDKINNMNTKFKFESIYYLKHLKSIFS